MINVRELTLVADDALEWEQLEGGIKRKVMSYNDDIMLVKVAFNKDGIGQLHSHPHLQISYVASGEFEVEIDNKKEILKQGDVFFIPSNVIHGVVCKIEGILIDVFSPMRKDFV